MAHYETDENLCNGCRIISVDDFRDEYEKYRSETLLCQKCECEKQCDAITPFYVAYFQKDEAIEDYFSVVYDEIEDLRNTEGFICLQHSLVYGCFCVGVSTERLVLSPEHRPYEKKKKAEEWESPSP